MSTATTARRTASDIARMFAERLPAHGGFISVKQTAWLRDQDRREQGRGYDPRGEAQGVLCETCTSFWRLHVARNGAGKLHLDTCAHRRCEVAGCSCKGVTDIEKRDTAVARLAR